MSKSDIQETILNERRSRERVNPVKLIPVYDYFTDKPIGELINLSDEGAMLITSKPVKAGQEIKCRLKLANDVLGRNEIVFGAECRWCRKNVKSEKWESGYKLKASEKQAEMISYLVLSFKLGHWGKKDSENVRTIEMENRRKLDRFEFRNPLPLFEFHNYRQIGQLVDISVNGARMLIDRPIKTNDILKCRIKLPRVIYGEDYLTFEAQCRWVRENKPYMNYESGYQISKISEKDSVIILYLITHSTKKRKTEKKYLIID